MKNAAFVLLILFAFLVGCGEEDKDGGGSSSSSSVRIGLLQVLATGQTNTYAVRDDGALRQGLAWPSPRFTDNGNGTVTDNLTGLMWESAAGTSEVDWAQAVTYANNATTGGHDDWRLPNVVELLTLFNRSAGGSNNWLNSQGFSGFQFAYYWTSTVLASDTGSARRLRMNGVFVSAPKSTTTDMYAVAVRGSSSLLPASGQTNSSISGDDGAYKQGVAWPEPRFTDNGDGTVTDLLTGLMWEKAPGATQMDWAGALAYAAANSAGGYSDWRVPNINELVSLCNFSAVDCIAWLQACGFSNLQSGYYWSSTTFAISTGDALTLSLADWNVHGNDKTSPDFYVWTVRGGD